MDVKGEMVTTPKEKDNKRTECISRSIDKINIKYLLFSTERVKIFI